MQTHLMHMNSGIDVDVFDLQPTDIAITDIAQHLANQCRFAGACKHFYSVAQHCVYVAAVIWFHTQDEDLTRRALLHDASEAFLGDIPRPLKVTKMFDFYRDVEAQVQRRIMRALGLTDAIDKRIERVDNEILALEAHSLFNLPFIPHSDEIPPVALVRWSIHFTEWDWYTARTRFLQMYQTPVYAKAFSHIITFQDKATL